LFRKKRRACSFGIQERNFFHPVLEKRKKLENALHLNNCSPRKGSSLRKGVKELYSQRNFESF